MDSNTHSVGAAERPTASATADGLSTLVRADGLTAPTRAANALPALAGTDGLAALAAAVDGLAAEDLDGLADGVVAERVLVLHGLVTRLEGQWLRTLAVVDGRGAAGADQDQQAPSTAGWLRGRLRLSASAATSSVRTARALFRGPLIGTAQAVTQGGAQCGARAGAGRRHPRAARSGCG